MFPVKITRILFMHFTASLSIQAHKIAERSLIFPTGSIFQISVGISIATDVAPNTGQVSFGFQQNLMLPTNVTQLRTPPGSRSNNGLGVSHVYTYIENVLSSLGFVGKDCLLKMICELARYPLSNGLLEEVVHYVLTPSVHTTSNPEYFLSEQFGRAGDGCSHVFAACPEDPLSFISSIAH